jgi:hypothetical protein
MKAVILCRFCGAQSFPVSADPASAEYLEAFRSMLDHTKREHAAEQEAEGRVEEQ